LSAYFDDVIPQQPALSNDDKQRQPALGDFTSPICMSLPTFLLNVYGWELKNNHINLKKNQKKPRAYEKTGLVF
jgi:hypothetical protein